MRFPRLAFLALLLGTISHQAMAADDSQPADQTAAPQSDDELHITITKHLTDARNNLSPQTGTNAYTIDNKAIENMSQGDNTSFNDVLEQAPGVAQDSYGQVHVRGEHANLQYRLNGILLPEGITGFGQVLDSRIMQSATLLDGALPAQYGYRTAGIIDIQTKTGFDNGGTISFNGGSNGTLQPSVEYGGIYHDMDYFLSASHLSSDLGIESPTSSPNAIHDHTEQDKQFAYMSTMINPMQRVQLIAGNSISHFEIPNNPNQTPAFTLNGVNTFDSSQLNEQQFESTQYATVAWQGQRDGVDIQIAPYIRNSEVHFHPYPVGDLIFNGIASDVQRTDLAVGVQGDGSWKINDAHTLRSGFQIQNEQATTNNNSLVFPLDGAGNPLTSPVSITDNSQKTAQLYGVYLQDEWKLTDRLTMNYGARFDVVNAYISEHQLSPRIGFTYKATDSTTLHAGYARYFTPPPLELIAPTSVSKFDNTTGQAANPLDSQVKSERSHNFDVGVTHQLTSRFQVGADAYYKLVHNLLDEGQFGQALVFTPFNYEEGKIYGLELTASYVGEKLKAYGNFSASRAMGKNVTSAQFNFDPDELAYIQSNYVHLDHDQTFTASGGVSYQVQPDTEVSLDGIVGSGLRSGFANTDSLPAYSQFDVGFTQTMHIIPHNDTKARFSVVNLFDTAYELRDGSGIGVGAPQWGPRRGYYVTLSQNF